MISHSVKTIGSAVILADHRRACYRQKMKQSRILSEVPTSSEWCFHFVKVMFCAGAQSEVKFAWKTLAKQTSLRSNFTAEGNFTCPKGKLSWKSRVISHSAFSGRGTRTWTQSLRFWRPPLYQLSYTPIYVWKAKALEWLVGLQGFEPGTIRLWAGGSNQLS